MLSNRYVKISLLGGGSIRISYTVMVGETPATAARRKADESGDGLLDPREIDKAAQNLQRAVSESLTIEVDGERQQPVWEPPVAGFSDGRVGPIPFSIDLVGRMRAPGAGPHRLRIDDQTVLESLGETEIRIEEGPGTRVLAGWRGREDGGRVLRFVFNGPRYSLLEDRSVGFRFADDKAKRKRPWPIALAGVAVAALVSAWLARRRGLNRRRA